MNINENLEEIIVLLENDEFIKAHDELESLWRDYKNDSSTRQESFILKAFLNASVYFEIYKMKRYNHALNLWNTYKKYEYLIDEINSINKSKYIQIQKLIYNKKKTIIK